MSPAAVSQAPGKRCFACPRVSDGPWQLHLALASPVGQAADGEVTLGVAGYPGARVGTHTGVCAPNNNHIRARVRAHAYYGFVEKSW